MQLFDLLSNVFSQIDGENQFTPTFIPITLELENKKLATEIQNRHPSKQKCRK